MVELNASHHFLMATPSNCGDSLKGFTPKPVNSKETGGQVNSLGYGKNVSHENNG